MITRSVRLTIRLTPAELDTFTDRAKAAGLPLRTWIQHRLVEPEGERVDSGAVLAEVRAVKLLTQKLWLSTADSQEARAEIMRIVNSVEAVL